jgi:hypothetical protein
MSHLQPRLTEAAPSQGWGIEIEGPVAEPVVARREEIDAPSRREHDRTRLVYRLVHVEHANDEGLARCRNISNGGMKLDLTMPVLLGSRIQVRFSAMHVLVGTVVWKRKGECGVALDEQIDSSAFLRESAAEARAGGFSGMRLAGDIPAAVRCDGRKYNGRVNELTQRSLKLKHTGEVYAGAHLSVALGGDKERPGIVRWSKDGMAEVALIEPFSVGELGSLRGVSGHLFQVVT